MPTRRNEESAADGVRLNSLGISRQKLDQLLDILDRQAAEGGRATGRNDARWPFRQASLRVRVDHPGGSSVEVRMACRNLSRTGAGLLHSSYVHTGTRCMLTLPHPVEGEVAIPGTIVRCQHRSGVLHEIGIRFDVEIDLRSFVRPDPLRELFSIERIDPQRLAGTLLYIDNSPLDAQLVRHFLKDTQVRIRIAENPELALEYARNGADVILCEHRLQGINGGELIERIRSDNITAPIIVTSTETSAEVAAWADGKLAQAFLSKPMTQERLVRALGEFLTRDGDEFGTGDRSLIRAMKPELLRCARAIEVAIERNQPMEALSMCMQLRNVAPSIGMKDIAGQLDSIIDDLSTRLSFDHSRDRLEQVVLRCRNAA